MLKPPFAKPATSRAKSITDFKSEEERLAYLEMRTKRRELAEASQKLFALRNISRYKKELERSEKYFEVLIKKAKDYENHIQQLKEYISELERYI